MAKNPMQRRANTSFILGILITLLITGIIIVFLVIQLMNSKQTIANYEANKVTVYVLNQKVSSGQTITNEMLEKKQVDKTTVPENAFNDINLLANYSLEDANGNSIMTNEFGELYVAVEEQYGNSTVTNVYVVTEADSGDKYYRYANPETGYDASQVKTENGVQYITSNNQKLQVTEIGGKYYTAHQETLNEEKVEYALSQVPIVAKVTMAANTVLTNSLITKSTEKVTSDLRKQEYSVIVLPTQIETGDYIDIRLRMPDGTDYIVVSHKEVEIPVVGDIDSADTIWLQMTEDEILMTSNAIVESYIMPGSMLYATRYVEPGLQEKATPTYLPSQEVKTLIDQDPNVIDTAKQALDTRYTNGTNRNNINDELNKNSEDAADNVSDKTDEEITKLQEERQQYLDSLT